MKNELEFLLGIAYSNSVSMNILASIAFSFFSLIHLYFVYKYCIQSKYLTKKQVISVMFSILYITLFLFLVPLTVIILAIFFAIKILSNEEKQ